LTTDYQYVGTMHDGSDDIVVQKNRYNNIDHYAQSSRLYRLNTRTRILSDLLDGNQPADITGWVRDVDNVPRIATSHVKGRCSTSYLAPASKTWTEISNTDCFDDSGFTPLSSMARVIYTCTPPIRASKPCLPMTCSRKPWLPSRWSRSPILTWTRGRNSITRDASLLGVHYDADAVGSVWFDPALRELQKKIDALLPNTNNILHCAEDCTHAPAVMVVSRSDRQPITYTCIARPGKPSSALAAATPGSCRPRWHAQFLPFCRPRRLGRSRCT